MITNLPNMLTGAAVKVIGASMITVPKTAHNRETPQKETQSDQSTNSTVPPGK